MSLNTDKLNRIPMIPLPPCDHDECSKVRCTKIESSPLPWKITNDDMELKITDANGNSVIYGNVNGGIEFNDPKVPGLIEQAISMLNRSVVLAK